MSKNHREREEVYAVVRWDGLPKNHRVLIENNITVKEIVRDQKTAEEEVDRLNELNKGKCHYFWQMTRLLPEGRSAGPNQEDRDASKA